MTLSAAPKDPFISSLSTGSGW